MLTKVSEAEVSSTEGFRIKVGRTRISYIDGDHAAGMDVEDEVDPYRLIVYGRSLGKWYPPHEVEAMDVSTRAKILERVSEALTFLSVPYEIVP